MANAKIINTLYTFVCETSDTLNIVTKNQILEVNIKDYGYSQIGVKPSVLTALKDDPILYASSSKTLSTSNFEHIKPMKTNKQEVFKVKEEPTIFDEEEIIKPKKEESKKTKDIQETKEVNKEVVEKKTTKIEEPFIAPVKKKEKKSNELKFEPISFDDLFSDDF